MPEVNLPNPMVNMAMEIKPADPIKVPDSQGADRTIQPRETESFDRVLERIERAKSQSRDAPVKGSNHEPKQAKQTDSEPVKSNSGKSESPETADEQVPQGTAENPGSTETVETQDGNSAQTGSGSSAESHESIPTDGSNAGNSGALEFLAGFLGPEVSVTAGLQAEPLVTAKPAQPALTVALPQPVDVAKPINVALPAQALPVLTIPVELQPPVAESAPVVALKPDLVSAIDARPVDLPVIENEGPLFNIQVGQNSREIAVPTNQAQVPQQMVFEPPGNPLPVQLEAPTVSVSNSVPESQWTNILEIDRLLNPSLRQGSQLSNSQQSTIQQNKTMQSFTADARPDVNVTSRNPEPSRFDWRTPEKPSGQVVENRLISGSKPEINQQPVIRESLLQFSEIYRPIIELPTLTYQPGTVIESNAVANVARAVHAQTMAAQKSVVNTETLVADIRDAVMRLASDGRGEVRIVMHPPELGELIVRIESSKNGVVRAEFHTLSPLVRESLEAGLHKLTEALEAEGLTLEHAGVYLNLGLGAEGNSGEPDANSVGNSNPLDPNDEEMSGILPGEFSPTVERLPEGATFSVLA